MDVPRMLRRLLPLLFLAALTALIARQRRARREAAVVVDPAPANEPLQLPPVQEALVVAEEAKPEDVTVVAVDIVTVVDDLLAMKR